MLSNFRVVSQEKGPMLDAALDTIEEFIKSLPVEAVATIAMLVGGVGLILTGWRHLVSGISGLFAAFGAIANAIVNFFQSILIAFGTTVGGLIILGLGAVAIWWVVMLLSGG
jgi:hypothetical protein